MKPYSADVEEIRALVRETEVHRDLYINEEVFQLEADVEMVFDGGFAAAGDHNNVGDAGMDGFFDAVLDDGLVDEGQHLFGLGLGGGEETGPETGGWENGFANFRGWHALSS